MMDAPSLLSISSDVSDALTPHEALVQIPSLDINIGLALPGMGGVTSFKNVRVTTHKLSKLVGIIFCLPETTLAKEEILPFVDYLNQRSGDLVDFFFAGYGTGWPPEYHVDQKVVATVDGVPWLFSAKAFDELRRDLATHTNWTFSGETDLVLLTAQYSAQGQAPISFSPSHACNLEQMAKDQAFTSPRAYLEAIAGLADKYKGNDPISYLSDQYGLKVGKDFLENALLSLVPDAVKDAWNAGKHHAIRDVSKGAGSH